MRGPGLPDALALVPVGALGLGANLVTTAGTWERSGDVARFTPRFAAVPGTGYAVVGRRDEQEGWRELTRVSVPEAELAPRTVVETIDPGTEWVPANLLRFSVTFSSVMEEGSATGHVQLLDEAGAVMPGTLLETPELWDRRRRRLTVLVEPGRIKRGLQPHVQAGAPLREGSTITLVVDPGLRDAEGAPLLAGGRRTYRVGAPVRSRVDPTRWDVQWPEEQLDPLVVRFDRPLDRALVQRCLRVVDRRGHPVPGHASLDPDARVWVFMPTARSGDWRLRIDARLEDLAGNSVRRVFDRDLRRSADDGIDAAEIFLTAAAIKDPSGSG
ncbi:hypothetical protein [Leifsonia sp. NPDC058248]|uniref:hypothetical protein n=1 Tax=Leifsonia sp. NPDC058248 TaxID=3346402 RepID=UPI0036DB2B7D